MEHKKKSFHDKAAAFTALFLILCMTASPVSAQIELAGVENGDVSVEQNGNEYNINASENAIANFSRFDIGADETVRFNLPSTASSMLNRVTGGSASEIFGSLFSNGTIFLINAMGIHFGSTAQVEIQGLVASTLNITNQDFLAGNYALNNDLNSAAAGISNEGNIQAKDGGFLVLAGNAVENLGSLTAKGGTVALAAGNKVMLGLDQGSVISVLVDGPVKAPILDAKGQPVQDLVKQAGTISAAGGQVFLSARATEEIFDHVINHTGIIEAQSLLNVGGQIILDGGNAGIVRMAGIVDASGLGKGEKGGTIQIYGDKIGAVEQALLDVTGNRGGGIILLGADYKGSNAAHPASMTSVGANVRILADAAESGNGGRVIVWSEDATRYYGNISAKGAGDGQGGFAEISSHGDLTFKGKADLAGSNGSAGTLLLDPSFLTITDAVDGAGSLDGELTPGTDAELLSSVPDNLTNTISRGQLEAFGPDANIILETSGLLRISDMAGNAINLKTSTGSLTLKAQNITFNDLNDVIRTEGGSITAQALLSQGKITGGGFDTTGLLGDKSGNITLSANTDISVGNIKTGGGTFTANADFDQAGNAGVFTVNSGSLVSTLGGAAFITASDVNLLGSLNTGDLNLSVSRLGTALNPSTIALGNAAGAFSLNGDELSRITAPKLTAGNALNDEITVDGVTAAQTQNIGETVLNAMRANRDILFQNAASFFKGLTLNTARDVISNAAVSVNGALNIRADHDVVLNQHMDAYGNSVVHADQEGNGSGDLILGAAGGLLTHDNSLEVRADEIKFNGFSPLSSGTGAMKLLVSDGGNIQIGNGANDFSIDADGFKNITAGDLTIGDSTSGDLISNGLQDGDLTHVTGTVTLNATGAGHKIIFSGNGSNFPNKLFLNAADGIQADKNIKTQQELFINADSDKNGTGTFSTGAGVSVTTGGHAIQITAKDLDLAAGSTVTSGASTISVASSNGGTIGVGNATGDMSISKAELQVLKANGLTIGDDLISSIFVDGVSASDIANVTNFLTLAATGPSSFISFVNGASSFNFLNANAGNGISVNTNLAMTAGNFKANADSDASGAGLFSIAAGSELSTILNYGVEVTAADADIAGNINTGRTGFITLMPSLSAAGIGLNDAAGTFNLSAAELNHFISTGPETPNVQVTVGRDGGTGHIDISSLSTTVITPSYNLKLKGGDTFFHNRLTLANSQTLELNAGTVTGSGVRDVNFTGGLGTLMLNTTGSVTLQTLMDRLGKSTVNGDLNLFDQVSLNLSGGAGGAVNVSGNLTLQSLRDINIDAPVTTGGTAIISADSDRNSSGNFNLGTNGSIVTNSHALQISSNDIALTAGSFLNSGTADTSLFVTAGGNIAVGQGAASDYTLNQNEIKLITAQNLVIGDNTSGNITVNGVSETQVAGIAGNTVFNATGAGKTVSFTGGGSIFQNSVTANASSGITLNKNLKTLNGTVTLNADTDAAGAGDFVMADGTSLNSSSHAIDITAHDFNLNTTAVIDSFQAPTAIHSSQSGTLRVGNGTGDMTVSKSELSRIKASALTLGGSKESIIVDTVDTADLALVTGALTLNAAGLTGDVSFINTPLTVNALSVNAGRNIQVPFNLTTLSGPLSLYADFDGNGTGDVNVADGVALSSGSNALDITAHHFNLGTGSTLSSGTAPLGIHNSDGGTLGFGAAAGDISVNDSMLDRITAGSLVLGGAGTGKISVDGVSAARSQQFSKVTLNALAAHGSIEFVNTPSTFNALDASANEGIAVNTPLTLDEGGLKANADFNKDGIGTFSAANGSGIAVPAAKNVEIAAADLDINADITGGDLTQFLISPSALNGSIGLNDALGTLNLSAAELGRFVLTAGSGLLRIGAQGGTGNVYIGSLGAFSIAGPFNFELFGGSTNFSNLLTLQDNRTATLNTGNTTGSGGTDLAVGGAAGKLLLKTAGAVNLKTSVAQLGASTVGGSLDLANDKDLNISGAVSTKNANGKMDFELGNHTLTMLAGSSLNSGSGDIILTADEIDLNGGAESVTSLGILTLRPGTASLSLGVAGGAGDLDISLTDLAAIHKNLTQLNIGRTDGSGAVTINTASFTDPVAFYSPAAGGSIYVNGALTGSDNASFTFFGSGSTTYLNAGITTTGDDIIIHDSVILGTNVTLATSQTGGGIGKIQIDGAINGPFNLTLKSGPSIDLKGPIGNTTPIGTGSGYALDLLTGSTGLSTLYGTLQANSGIRSQGPVKFMEDVTLAAGNTGSLFLGEVILDGLSFSAAGGVQFGDTASDDVTLSSGPVSISTSNAPITINGKMNGSQNLTLDSGTAATVFNADAGAIQRLGDSTGYAVNVKSQGMTTFQRLNLNSGILTAGPVTFLLNVLIAANGNVSFLKGDTILSGLAFNADNGVTFGDSSTDVVRLEDGAVVVDTVNAPIIFNARVEGSQDFSTNAGTGQTDFYGNVGALEAMGDGVGLAFNSNSTGATLFHGTFSANSGIKTTGTVTFKDNVVIAAGDKESLFNGDVVLDGLSMTSGRLLNFGNNALDAVTLSGGPVSITTLNNSKITFLGTLNGSQNLTLDSGTAGIDFLGNVGNLNAIGSGTGAALNLNSTGLNTFNGTLKTNSGINAAGPVLLKEDVTIGSGDTASKLNGNVTLDGLTFIYGTHTELGDSALDAITLSSGPVTFTSANGANLTFRGTPNGAQDLTFNGGTGNLTFETAVTGPNFVHISSAKDVSFNSTVQTPGDFLQSAGTGTTRFSDSVNASAINITAGAITLTGNGNLNAGAGAGAITLTAQTGAITSGTSLSDLTAASLIASAASGIGTLANPLLTAVSALEAYGGTGGVYITNTGALAIGGLSGMAGVSALSGGIQILTKSPLTVNELVKEMGGGNITLAALGKTVSDDLTLNANVVASGGNGNIIAAAGDTLTFASGVVVSAAQNGTVKLASGEDFTDGILNQDGNKGVTGGDIVMAGNAKAQSDNGDITVDAARNLTVGIINANANGDKTLGNVYTFSRAGVTTDANGKDLNITAAKLTMISSGNIGSKQDPVELASKTKINSPAYTSFPACSNASGCESDRYVKEVKEAKEPKPKK